MQRAVMFEDAQSCGGEACLDLAEVLGTSNCTHPGEGEVESSQIQSHSVVT